MVKNQTISVSSTKFRLNSNTKNFSITIKKMAPIREPFFYLICHSRRTQSFPRMRESPVIPAHPVIPAAVILCHSRECGNPQACTVLNDALTPCTLSFQPQCRNLLVHSGALTPSAVSFRADPVIPANAGIPRFTVSHSVLTQSFRPQLSFVIPANAGIS